MNAIKKALKWIGIVFLWMAVSGTYNVLVMTDNIFEAFKYVWLVLLIGVVLHQIGSKGFYKRSDNILDVMATLISLRGIISIVIHFLAPSSFWSTITYSLIYGIIFFVAGSLAMFSLNRIWINAYKRKVAKEIVKESLEVTKPPLLGERAMKDLLIKTIKEFEVVTYLSSISNLTNEPIEKVEEINDGIKIHHRSGTLSLKYDDIEKIDGGDISISTIMMVKLKSGSEMIFKTVNSIDGNRA